MPAPLDRLLLVALNHLLGPSDWARSRLLAHEGKSVRLRVARLEVSFAVGGQGLLAPAGAGEVDLILDVPVSAGLALRAGDPDARRRVRVDGDAALAADLAFVAGHLDWDGEADLARLVGDIAARRIAQAGRAIASLPAQATSTLARSTSRFVVAEHPVAADRAQVEAWTDAVDRLRDDVERLAARIARLEVPPARR